jgi:uncharacterized membrane protein (UPF0127 family)
MILNKKIIFILVASVLVLSLALFLVFSLVGHPNPSNRMKIIKINEAEFKVETAISQEELERGLSGRDNLCENCGMLFEFDKKGEQAFWMKGMKFPLDIIWINGDKIVYIARNIPADYGETIRPEVEADRVLEINSGTADRLGIKEGDKVEF